MPVQPAIACESNPRLWHSASHESMTAKPFPFKPTQRRVDPCGPALTKIRSSTISLTKSLIDDSLPSPIRTIP